MNLLLQLDTSATVHQKWTNLAGRKISKDMAELNSSTNQLNIIDIYRKIHPTTAYYTFFLSSPGHSLRQTTLWAIKYTLTNLKVQKSYHVGSQTTVELNQKSHMSKRGNLKTNLKIFCTGGFPGGAVVENLPANAGHTGSSPGLGRSHMPRSNQAHEPQLLSLSVWSLCSTTREAAIVRGPHIAMKSGPRLLKLEKALAQKRRPNTAKSKQ